MGKWDYIEIDTDDIKAFRHINPANEFRILAPAQVEQSLFRIVPSGLWAKTDSLFIMSSGNATGTAYCMINCSRYDSNVKAIDQEPIFFAYIGNQPICSGIIIHHGKWKDRTTKLPDEFQNYLLTSGLGNYYPIKDFPVSTSGPITEIKCASIHGAFETGVKRIIAEIYK